MTADIIEQPKAAKPFRVKLPSEGKIVEFRIKEQTPKIARSFYMHKRTISAITDDLRDLAAREGQVDKELAQYSANPSGSETQIAELKAERININAIKEKSDVDYFDAQFQMVYAILDTDLDFKQIDWDDADLKELNGAMSFFQSAVKGSTFNTNS